MADQAAIAEKHSPGHFLSAGPRRTSRKRRVGRIAAGCVLIAGTVASGSCTSSRLNQNERRDATTPPNATVLNGVSAVSAEDARAVGQVDLATTTEAQIVHWDGTRWSRVSNPNVSSDFYSLSGVSAVSPTDAWAVGDSEYGDETLIVHWDGTRWSRVTSPNRGSVSNGLSGVSAVSPTDAWAVGGAGSFPGPGPYVRTTTLILHWDGNTWSQVVSPNPSPRKVHLGGATANPDSAWIAQQARNLAMALQEGGWSPRILIHDRDTKFSGPFKEVFRSEGVRVILTPIRAPNANAFCERWVDTVRGRVPGLDPRPRPKAPGARPSSLRRALQRGEAASGAALQTPTGSRWPAVSDLRAADVRRRDVLGGLIHEYQAAA
jgi:hypothetical protein